MQPFYFWGSLCGQNLMIIGALDFNPCVYSTLFDEFWLIKSNFNYILNHTVASFYVLKHTTKTTFMKLKVVFVEWNYSTCQKMYKAS